MENSIKRLYFLIVFACASVPLFFLRYTKDCFLLPKYTLISLCAVIGAVLLSSLLLNSRIEVIQPRSLARNAFRLGQLFFFTVFVSFAFSSKPSASLTALPVWVGYYVFFTASIVVWRSRERWLVFVDVLCGVVAVVSAYAVLQYFDMDIFGWDIDSADIRLKAFSTLGNPQIMAVWLSGCMPLILASFLGDCCFTARRGRWKLIARGVVLLLCFCAMLVSHARTGIISVAVGFPVVLFFLGAVSRRFRDHVKKYIRIWLTVIGLFLAATLFTPFYSGAAGRAGLKSETFMGRWITWSVTADIIRANPVIGTGPGTFSYFYPLALRDYFTRASDRLAFPEFSAMRRDWAHNDPLQICSESGIAAGVLFVGFLLLLLLFCARVLFRVLRIRDGGNFVPEQQKDILGRAGIFAALCALCATTLFHFMLFNPSSGLLFFVFAGAGLNIDTEFPMLGIGQKDKKLSAFSRLLVCEFVLLIAAAGFVQLSAKPFIADLYARRGHSLMNKAKNIQAQEVFEKSLAFYPANGQTRFLYAVSFMNTGNYAQALLELNRTLDDLVSEMVYFAIGNCNMNLWNMEAARDAFEAALGINPFFHDARINLGLVYYRLGDFDRARMNFMVAAEASRSDFIKMNAYANLGAVCYRDAKSEEAMEYWNEVLKLSPDDKDMTAFIEKSIARAGGKTK